LVGRVGLEPTIVGL